MTSTISDRAAWPPPTLSAPPSPSPPPQAAPPRDPGLDRSDLTPKPLPSRPLWMIFGTLLMLGTVFWGSFQIVSLLAHEEWDQSYTTSAEGISELRVTGDNGRVIVRGADTDEITVEARISRGLFGIDESADRVGDTYEVSADCPPLGGEWCFARYEITVPRSISLVIDADNGRVAVSNVEGTIEIDSDNGRVELTDVTGSVRVRGDNGRIVGTGLLSRNVDVETDNGGVELSFADAPDSVVATSDNGSIDLVLPPVEGDYNVEPPDTINGRSAVNVASDPASGRLIRTETDNGSITIRYP